MVFPLCNYESEKEIGYVWKTSVRDLIGTEVIEQVLDQSVACNSSRGRLNRGSPIRPSPFLFTASRGLVLVL